MSALRVCLRGVGNVDRGQYADVAGARSVAVSGLGEAVRVALAFRDSHGLGAGNFVAWIERAGVRVADVSFNGRVWQSLRARSGTLVEMFSLEEVER